jgi:type II secretory pathway predicted ATPase ExeA
MNNYRHYFGFSKEPFRQDIALSELYQLPGLDAFLDRFEYCINLRAVNIVIGEIGSGKSTSLRYAASKRHPSEYTILSIIAHNGTTREFFKQISHALGSECLTGSITGLLNETRTLIKTLAGRKQTPILIIDEAQLLRPEVFAHLHTLMQFDFDSRPLMPIILCGHTTLIDKLHYHTSRALASRVVGKTCFEIVELKTMNEYINHHLAVAGVKEHLFAEQAVVAIHQGSGGVLRKANTLARGALIAASCQSSSTVEAEHVRIAATEVI